MKRFSFLVSLLLFIISHTTNAQFVPSIQWQKTYGGPQEDHGTDIAATFDHGYIMAGYSHSSTGDLTSNQAGFDYWVVKLDSVGVIKWQTSIGGERHDRAYSIIQTADSGYVVTGGSASFKGLAYVDADVYTVKLDRNGKIVWQNIFRGSQDEEGNSVIQTADGGYAVAGYTYSSDGDIVNKRGSLLVLKLTANGTLQWQKTYGGTGIDVANSIIQTKTGELLVAGKTSSIDNDVTNNHGKSDYWLLKLDTAGNMIWQKTYGGTEDDFAYDVKQTREGGYILSGSSSSFRNPGSDPEFYYWLIKLDTSGTVQWTTPVNNEYTFHPYSIEQTTDDGYIVGGSSYSAFPEEHGNGDYFLAKFNKNGKFQWQKFLGGNNQDYGMSAIQTKDEGYIITGYEASASMDVSGNHGGFDVWVVKLAPINDDLSLCPPSSSFTLTSETANATNYQWQVNDGNGYADLSDNSYYTGTKTSTLHLNNIPSTWYSYRYRCFADTTTYKTFTAKFSDMWTGAIDRAWENPKNWSCNILPDGNTDVIINSNNPPILNSNASCKSLNLKSGSNATLLINAGYKLDIKGFREY